MAKNNQNSQWRREQTRFGLALVISLIITAILFRVARVSPLALIFAFIILNIIILQFFGFQTKNLSKVFIATLAEAEIIVTAVLEEKGLPYQQDRDVFFLEEIPLKIVVRPYVRRQVDGVLIQFIPYEGENIPLVTSLSQRLDDAFSPKGL